MSSLPDVVCAAITTRTLLSFLYDGLPRVVIPCALGEHKSTGRLLLRWRTRFAEQRNPATSRCGGCTT